MIQQDSKKAYDYACRIQPKLKRVCMPLFSCTAMHAFMYYQQQPSGHALLLSSHKRWLDQLYVDDAWLDAPWLQEDLSQASTEGYHCQIWQADERYRPITSMLNLYRQSDDQVQHVWSFASYYDGADLSLYFAKNSELVKLFATRLMQLCYPMMYPDMTSYISRAIEKNKSCASDALLRALVRDTPLKVFPIMRRGEEYWITHVEAICLQGMSEGKTAKMIGRDLGLSYRTVEKHVENLKKKLWVQSRSELIYVFNQSRERWV